MTKDSYIRLLEDKFLAYFDVSKQYEYNNMFFEIYAKSNVKNQKYFASKKAVVYSFENNEYCFVKYKESIDEHSISSFTNLLTNAVDDFVNPHPEHMSSCITGVLITDNIINTEIINTIEKFKYHKSFVFGFKGWVDIRLVLVDLNKNKVYTNKKAKNVSKFYKASGL